MRSSPLASRTALAGLLISIACVSAQSSPGGRYFAGSGAPNAAAYQLVDEYSGENFFDKFNYYTLGDFTWGHVKYVNETVAEQNGFTYVSDRNTAVIKPDTTNNFPRGVYDGGRPSVRITSDNSYYHGLFVFDATHIPTGCGTWPAYWLLGPDWPSTGEIDIIEGTNTAGFNTMAMHTGPNCSIAGSGQTGTFTRDNCDQNTGGTGCGSELRNTTALPNNYGVGFNNNQGGVYVTEWTSSYIKHWWFPRDSIPSSIEAGAPDVSQFGVPAVNAQGSCDIDSHFQNMSIVINICFCGSWAGTVYSEEYPNCPQSDAMSSLDRCVDFVGNNPTSLTEAYWDINRIQVYQMPANIATTSIFSTSLSSVTTGLQTTNTINMGMGGTTSTLSSIPFSGPLSSPTTSAVASSTHAGSKSTASTSSSSSASSSSAPGPPPYVSTSTSASTSEGLTWTSEVELTSWDSEPTLPIPNEWTAHVPAPVVSSPVVETSTSTWTSDGVTWSSDIEVTSWSPEPTPSLPDEPTYYVPTPVYSSPIVSTEISTWTSDGITFSSTAELTSWSSVVFPSTRIAPSTIVETTISEWTSDGLTLSSASAVASTSGPIPAYSVSPPPGGCTYNYPEGFEMSIRNVSGAGLSRIIRISDGAISLSEHTLSLSKRQQMSVFTVSNGYLRDDQGLIAFIAANGALTWSDAIQPGTIYWNEWSVCENGTIAISGYSTFYTCVGSSGFAEIYVKRGEDSYYEQNCGQVYIQALIGAAASSSLALSSASATTSTVPSSTAPPPPPCPVAVTDVCGATGPAIPGCASASGQIYQLTCGKGYYGTTIPEDQITTGSSKSNSSSLQLKKRYSAPDVPTCQAACDATAGCVAVTFLPPTNCTLFSEVLGTYDLPGAVGAAQVAELPPTYDDGTSITTTQTQNVASLTTTVTGTNTQGLPTVTVPNTNSVVTVTPTTTTVVTTLPTGGSFTSVTSGLSTGSYYVYTTSTSIGIISQSGPPQSVCYTCGIVPTICPDGSNCGLPSGPPGPSTSPSVAPMFSPTSLGTCPRVVSGTGYVTVHTTYTYTTCVEGALCPNPGYSSMGPRPSGTPGTSASSTATGISTALPTCPYSNGAGFIDPMGKEYTILCDTLFTDETLVTQTQSRLADCIDSCDMYNIIHMTDTTQCEGVSFLEDQDTDNCLLKSGTTTVNQANTHSGKLVKRAVNPGGPSGYPSGVTTAPNPSGTGPGTGTGPPATVTQYIPGLANCSQTCVTDFGGCAEDDAACICSNKPLLDRYSCCVSNQCDAQGQAEVVSFASSLCASYGVTTLPTSAACTPAPTPPIYIPGLANCSQTCVTDFGGCADDDAECICSNEPLLQRYSCCVSQRCDAGGQAEVVSFASSLCASYGVTTLPTSAACYPTQTQVSYIPGATATNTIYIPGLANCSQTCVTDFGGCADDDAECICSNKPLLERYSCCVSRRCDEQGQAEVVSFASSLCASYGVTTLPTSAGCLPTETNTLFLPGPTATNTIYIPGLANCSQTCVTDFGGCADDDAECICSNKPLLEKYSCCVSRRCDEQGQAEVVSFASSLCASYGVTTLPTSAGCLPTETNTLYLPGSTATASIYIPGLANCSQTCVTDFGGCAEDDAACICSNEPLLERYSCCVSRRCDAEGQAEVVNFATSLCAEYGVTNLPTSAGCLPTQTIYSPGPTVYTSGPQATATETTSIYIPGLQNCAQTCVTDFGGCADDDAECICSNSPLLERYSCCVARRCDDAGQSEVVSFASSLCASYGVTTLPTSAGCLPTITTTLVPITTVVGGSTVVSTAMQTVTAYPSGYTPGPGSYPGPTQTETQYVPTTAYVTQYSTIVSNGNTIIQTIGVSTVVNTVIQVSSIYIPGPTVTQTGGTATVTQVGPTVTASVGGGSGSGGGATVTVTGPGSYGGQTTVTAPPVTVTQYIFPSTSSRSSVCRTYSTNYYKGLTPYKRDARTNGRSLFSPEGPHWESPEERRENAKPKLL